jgi:TolA-binding protein
MDPHRALWLRRLLCAAPAAAVLVALPVAHAEPVDKIGSKLVKFEGETRQIVAGIRRPSELGVGGTRGRDVPTRRTIDAQVNFGVGNYDDAAIVLYDVVDKYPQHPVYDEALYYLAESLFMKGDFVASRNFFVKLVKERGSQSKFYQQGLERLVELTLKLNDAENIDEWLKLLDAVPASERRSSVPYVRGKYAFYSEKYDEAIQHFSQVARKSSYYFQARYFIGASYVAKKDLAKAVVEYQKLTREPTKNRDEKRVVELSNMALGRIHYERNQPSKAIDRYLNVSRRSDLFDETMFEASWVYVKNKEFDKALRALELLALSDPLSTRLPEVKILEGNLRIRKAQRLSENNEKKPSDEEYARALVTFDKLRGIFDKPHAELKRVVDEKHPAIDYLAQVTGRHAETFDIKATLPEVAAAWLREEPEVKRIVAVEADLGQIEGDIQIAETTIYRLEQALLTATKTGIFPALADKKIRATEIQDELIAVRSDLATQLGSLLASNGVDRGEIDRLSSERKSIAAQLSGLPDARATEGERISRARGRAAALDRAAAEVQTIINNAESQLVAMEKFLQDQGYKEVKPGDLAELKKEIDINRTEVEALKGELGGIKGDIMLARDRAGTGDETSIERNRLREALRRALDAELAQLQTLAARLNGDARNRANQIAGLARKSDGIAVQLDRAMTKIEQIVEEALVEVNAMLADEKAKLSAYTQEYTNYDGESHALGGEVLGLAFTVVSKKLYEVLIRSDVGVVDVAWSIKESADGVLRRLTLDQARENRTLDSEFSDVIQEIRDKREAEVQKAGQTTENPTPETGGTNGGGNP